MSPPNVSLSILITHYPIMPSPNSHTSPSYDNLFKNDASKSNPSESNKLSKSYTSSNNLSESNGSILSMKVCVNVIKGGNLPPIPLH